jgi:hypothetical protein
MDGLGDLFGSIGEMLSGLGEGAGEAAADGAVAAMAFGRRDGETPSMTASVDRYLCGGPRVLNVNDI